MAEITYTFKGMNNVSDPADVGAPDPKRRDLLFTEGVLLSNVDMDDNGGVSLRPGRIAVSNGAGYHSGWSNPNGTEAYYVKAGVLWRMTATVAGNPPVATPAFTLIRSGLSNNPMNFVQINDVVRYSNGTQCGVIEGGVHTTPFTPTMQFKAPMVAGKYEEFYNGRLYALVDQYDGITGCALICSDPMDVPGGIESMDERTNIVAVYSGAAKGICRVDDGLFVSAGEETFFHGGGDPFLDDGFNQKSVAPYAMVPGTVRHVRAEILGVDGLKGWACIWASTRGVCVGGNGGYFVNMTHEKVSYPAGTSGTALVREQGGVVHYLFVLQSPAASAYNAFLPRSVEVQSTETP